MYKIDGTTIHLTRGDTFETVVQPKQANGSVYSPVEGDTVRFALKSNVLLATGYADSEPLIEKTIPNDTMILEIAPSDTKQLAFGDYVYDVELTYADGTVDTFINNALFKIVPEVD